jgi:hypothetical protein
MNDWKLIRKSQRSFTGVLISISKHEDTRLPAFGSPDKIRDKRARVMLDCLDWP